VFDVTKRKFHNVLQGVAKEGTQLKPQDRELFEKWTEWNYNKYWDGAGKGGDGGQEDEEIPIEADIAIIDDPQCKRISKNPSGPR
jgi:hypothetical protein